MNPLENPKWNFWQALYLILLVYLVEYILGWLQPLDNPGYLEGYVNYLVIGFGEGLLFLAALFLFLKLMRSSPTDLGLADFGLKSIFGGIIGGIVLFLLVGFSGDFIARLLGVPKPQSFALVLQGTDSLWQMLPLILLGGIIVPLKEELIFRGLIYPPLRKSYGRRGGMLFSALFFALLHFDVVRFLPLFIGGFILTWLYEKTKSLWTSIIAHGVWNILMTILMWWQKG